MFSCNYVSIKITCRCLMASLYDNFRVSVSVSIQRSCVRVIRAWFRFFRSLDFCSSKLVLFASAILKEKNIIWVEKLNISSYKTYIDVSQYYPQTYTTYILSSYKLHFSALWWTSLLFVLDQYSSLVHGDLGSPHQSACFSGLLNYFVKNDWCPSSFCLLNKEKRDENY